jgi:hypothetical protein
MPEVRRHALPRAVFRHLLDRLQTREIPADQLGLLAEWLDTNPVVPAGRWFKKFPEMIVCGEGELVKTVLTKEQIPFGEEVV